MSLPDQQGTPGTEAPHVDPVPAAMLKAMFERMESECDQMVARLTTNHSNPEIKELVEACLRNGFMQGVAAGLRAQADVLKGKL